jgi:hypothetical protein
MNLPCIILKKKEKKDRRPILINKIPIISRTVLFAKTFDLDGKLTDMINSMIINKIDVKIPDFKYIKLL